MEKVSAKHIEQDKRNITRVLQWADIKKKNKIGNPILGSEEFTKLDLNDLREIFGIKGSFDPDGDIPYNYKIDPHMHKVYDVTEEQAKKLQPYLEHQMDLNTYVYYVSRYARS